MVPIDGTIKKFVINKNDYDLDIFEASKSMKENIDAKKEGVLRIKSEHSKTINDEIKKMIDKLGKLPFFIK